MFKRELSKRKVYWVVFEDRMSLDWHWWHIFLKPGFYHCWVFTAGDAGTITMQHLRAGWHLGWHPCEPHELGQELYSHPESRYRVLVIDRPTSFSYTWRGVITCVSVVKACLNIRCWAITPYQLYRHLLEIGAYEVGT